MNKILNWLFGSFFRTIGKVVAFLVIGTIFAYIISSDIIKLPNFSKILLFGDMNVSAATLNITSNSGYSVYFCETGTGSSDYCTNNQTTGKVAFNTAVHPSGYSYGSAALFYGSSNFLATNTYTITFRTHFGFDDQNQMDYIIESAKNWKYIVNGYVDSTTGYSDTYITNFSCSSRYDTTTTNGIITNCTVQLNTNVSRLQVKTTYWEGPRLKENYNFYVSAIRTQFMVINYSEGVGSQINNQTIIIENGLNDINNTLTDDHIKDDDITNSLLLPVSDESFGFFSSFLTLPLDWVKNILASNQQCQVITLDLPFINGEEFVLPCMNLFWERMGALSTLLQMVWIAVVGTRVFNGLFKLTVDSISSQDNVEELYKLRSWEL